MRGGFISALLLPVTLAAFMPDAQLAPVAQGQEPKPQADAVRDVLLRVKQRAETQNRDDQRRALLLVQQSQEAFKAGRLEDSLKTVQKARLLFPASAEIQQAYRQLQAEQRRRRDQALNLKEALGVLDEGLAHVNALVDQGRYWHALQFAEAVRDAAGRLPGAEAAAARKAIEKFLEDFNAWVASDPPELHVRPREPATDSEARPRTPGEVRRALARLLSVDWQNERLVNALAFVARETGVPVRIDPALERLRVPANRRLNLRVQQTSAERLLKLIAELSETELLLAEGHALITTKESALLYTLARGRDPQEAERLLRRLLPLDPGRPRPEEPEPLAVKPARLPAYLESADAFTQHIEELLKPFAHQQAEP